MASSNQASQIRDSVQATFKIFIKDLRDRHGRKRALTIRSWSTVKDVKDQLQQLLHVPPSAQHLYFGPLKELPNHRSLHDAGIYKSGETLLLDIKSAADGGSASSTSARSGIGDDNQSNYSISSISSLRASGANDICISSSMLDSTPKALRRIIQQARRGLMIGLKPILVLDGSGGTYFMHDARKLKVAVFKPADEEPYAENNPRGYVKQHHTNSEISLREGIRPGEACLREVAAFLLDHGGFGSVPMTTLAEARHPAFNTNGSMLKLSEGGASKGTHSLPSGHSSYTMKTSSSSSNLSTQKTLSKLMKKVGSCQEFIVSEDTMDDISPSKLSAEEVHKIAILDIRILNADRNAANLLLKRKHDNTLELIPIDHGYCLRSVCDISWFDWCWLDWPQLKEPLSQKSKDYILSLDIDADVRLLQESLQIGTEALDFFRASTKILQAGVKAGLTLYDIAIMCCRYDNAGEIPSKLEVLTSQAKDLSMCAIQNGRWSHAAASRAIAEQISPMPSASSHLLTNSSMGKSKSHANFSSFAFDLTTAEESPASAHTSGSESSSSEMPDNNNDFNLDQDDCQEWAAGIVADVDCLDSSYRRPRSLSENSLDSFSSFESPADHGSVNGFWRVRPGDTDIGDNLSWTPSPSPSLPSISSRTEICSCNDDNDETPSKPNVTFVGISPETRQTYMHSNCGTANKPLGTSPPLPSRTLVRSHSYSALSLGNFEFNETMKPTLRNYGTSTSTESDNFRLYLHKFVDLLIEREILASSRRRDRDLTSVNEQW